MKQFGKIGTNGCSDFERYNRQLSLPEIGNNGQEKLFSAKILVVGAGGLGSPIILYLAGAGIGNIGIIDDDYVSLSNLQRQILFNINDLNKNKALVAKDKVNLLNHNCNVIAYPYKILSENATQIIKNYDIVIDACDNFSTRKIVDNVCASFKKIFIYGSIEGFKGQIAVFDYSSKHISYNTLFSSKNEKDDGFKGGVIGATAGIIGSIQAAEAIKIILNSGNKLINKFLLIDLLINEYKVYDIPDFDNAIP